MTPPSGSMRTARAAPTRLRLSARIWPLNRLKPETWISAFGALATTVPSGSRTTISRTRTAAPPFSVRSNWVPPTSTRSRLPKFSSIADTSHGVKTSSWIGPLESRHHRPPQRHHQDADDDCRTDTDAPDEALMPRQKPPIGSQIAAVPPASTTVSCGEVTPASRMNGAFPSRGRRTLPVLVRHARSGVPVVSRSRSSHVSAARRMRTSESTIPQPTGLYPVSDRRPLPAGLFWR